jgi:hypothetical protein
MEGGRGGWGRAHTWRGGGVVGVGYAREMRGRRRGQTPGASGRERCGLAQAAQWRVGQGDPQGRRFFRAEPARTCSWLATIQAMEQLPSPTCGREGRRAAERSKWTPSVLWAARPGPGTGALPRRRSGFTQACPGCVPRLVRLPCPGRVCCRGRVCCPAVRVSMLRRVSCTAHLFEGGQRHEVIAEAGRVDRHAHCSRHEHRAVRGGEHMVAAAQTRRARPAQAVTRGTRAPPLGQRRRRPCRTSPAAQPAACLVCLARGQRGREA